jgi:membrane protein
VVLLGAVFTYSITVTCEARDELAEKESKGERSNSGKNSGKNRAKNIDKEAAKGDVVLSSEGLVHSDSKLKSTAEIK